MTPMYNPIIAPMTTPKGPLKKISQSGPCGEFGVRRMAPAKPTRNNTAPTVMALPIHQRATLGRSTSKSPRKLPQASPAAMPRTRPNSEGHLGPTYPPEENETIAPSSDPRNAPIRIPKRPPMIAALIGALNFETCLIMSSPPALRNIFPRTSLSISEPGYLQCSECGAIALESKNGQEQETGPERYPGASKLRRNQCSLRWSLRLAFRHRWPFL